jgi:hypothetical protein
VISVCTLVGQINWDIEIVDSTLNPPNEFQYQNALTLDRNDVPNIIFNGTNFNTLVIATRVSDNVWVKEIIDNGSFDACPSLVFDRNNKPHCCYYQKVGSTAYLYHTFFDSLIWNKEVIDSMNGVITNYWYTMAYFNTAIAIDSLDHCGIAYISWDQIDSVFFVKYARYDGSAWNVSTVEYDTAWSPHLQPSDWAVNLEFNHQNIPIIAFHHIYSGPDSDTIKLARWNDTLNNWIVESVINGPYGGASISFALNNQDYPYLAHGVDVGLYCSWWDGIIWQSEYTGIDIGWLSIRLALDIDSFGNPHIFYHANGPVKYCYKDTLWHDCGRLDSTLDNLGDISLTLNSTDQPNVSFRFGDWDSIGQYDFFGIKYGIGTNVAIKEETNNKLHALIPMKIYPNPFTSKTKIVLSQNESFTVGTLRIYDITGRKVKIFRSHPHNNETSYVVRWDGTDDFEKKLPGGIYFAEVTTGNLYYHQKMILLRN